MYYSVFKSEGIAINSRPLPQGYEVEVWHPGWTRIVPPTLGLKFAFWWILHQLRLFANTNYSVILIRSNGCIVHRTCLIPRYFRWRFMGRQDLQISSTWTDPTHRRRGLASYSLQRALAEWANQGRTVWYVTQDDNEASLAVCYRNGFRLLTQANRTERFGFRVLGELVLMSHPEAKG